VPAAAVIPAPIAYIKVVAVKKLVVGLVCAPVSAVCRQKTVPTCGRRAFEFSTCWRLVLTARAPGTG
jgi:hypothetical protein